MKKTILAVLLTIGMAVSVVGCGGAGGDSSGSKEAAYADATTLMTAAWDQFSEELKFPGIGGSMAKPVDNAPGKFDTSDTDTMDATFLVPQDVQGSVTDMATLVHMMNTNTFTGAVIKVDGMDTKAVMDKIEERFKSQQFMCGMPDKMILVDVDGYVVYAYGETANVDEFGACAGKLTNVNSDVRTVLPK